MVDRFPDRWKIPRTAAHAQKPGYIVHRVRPPALGRAAVDARARCPNDRRRPRDAGARRGRARAAPGTIHRAAHTRHRRHGDGRVGLRSAARAHRCAQGASPRHRTQPRGHRGARQAAARGPSDGQAPPPQRRDGVRGRRVRRSGVSRDGVRARHDVERVGAAPPRRASGLGAHGRSVRRRGARPGRRPRAGHDPSRFQADQRADRRRARAGDRLRNRQRRWP